MEQPLPGPGGQAAGRRRLSVTDDLLASLSPLQFDHINFLGRYVFFRPQVAGHRPLREPSLGEDDGEL